MTRLRYLGGLLAGTLLALPSLAQAQANDIWSTRGFYAGGGFGYSNVRAIDDDDWYSDTSYGDADFAYTITGGYRIMRYLAVEASYVDYGKPEYDDDLVDLPDLGDIYATDTEIDIDSYRLMLMGILPLADDKVEFFVKAGASFWDAESDQFLQSRTGGSDIRRTIDRDGTDFVFGFGAALNLAKHWHLRLEMTSQQIDDELMALGNNDDASIETANFQVHYRFGDNW